MFHFAGFAPAYMRVSDLRRRGCPIRRPSDQGSLAPPRSFSQLTASFFADKCQGILRVPFTLFSPIMPLPSIQLSWCVGKIGIDPNW